MAISIFALAFSLNDNNLLPQCS